MKHTRTTQVRGAVLIAAVAFLPTLAGAATLRILTPTDPFVSTVFGLEGSDYTSMKAKLGSVFSTIESVSLGSLNAGTGADAYWINLVNYQSSYTNAELATIAGLKSSSSPAVILFENNYWAGSNGQLATALGGTYLGEVGSAAVTLGSNPLLQNVISLNFNAAGLIDGGTEIAGDAVSLFGPQQNLLLIGDVNFLNNEGIVEADNDQFGTNVARFLSGSSGTSPVPEPSAALLGMLGACALLFRRRAK